MIRRPIITLLLSLLALAAGAARAAATPQATAAAWLSQQLGHPLAAQQVVSTPALESYDGCRIQRQRTTAMGGTSMEVRCPGAALPQLVLLSVRLAPPPAAPLARPVHPLVRAGAHMQAHWATPSMRVLLPAVALDAGSPGAEIRIRVAGGKRILRARIISAHTAEVLTQGA